MTICVPCDQSASQCKVRSNCKGSYRSCRCPSPDCEGSQQMRRQGRSCRQPMVAFCPLSLWSWGLAYLPGAGTCCMLEAMKGCAAEVAVSTFLLLISAHDLLCAG